MSDNYRFQLDGETKEEFAIAMQLAFRQFHKGWEVTAATHFAITPSHGLVLIDRRLTTTEPTNIGGVAVQQLPYKMNCEAATAFVWNWLKSTQFPAEPDHDGSNKKGFSVFNEAWGHVLGDHYAFAAIRPDWQMYGK